MRLPAIAIAILIFVGALVPAQAQTCCFDTGFYEFENEIAAMLYSGTWTTSPIYTSASTSARVSTVSGSVSFRVAGDSVVIWRYVRPSGQASRMDACVNGVCIPINNETAASWGSILPFALMTAPGDTITITWTLGTIVLDSFMVLSSASGSFPTAVPTATILPSSTPASTTTPQPTPTPQPTATPMSVVFAIDPEKSYGSANGQITSVSYSATAADIHLGNLLTTLLYSVWGMFFFAVFVLVRYRKK